MSDTANDASNDILKDIANDSIVFANDVSNSTSNDSSAVSSDTSNVILKPGERFDDLSRNGLKLIQRAKGYRFGMDSVLLAHFAQLGKGRVLDMGAGTGALCTLCADTYPDARFTALEIQPELADMLRRSVSYNSLEAKIEVVEGDLRVAPLRFGRIFDSIICNPPYKKRGSGLKNDSDSLYIARAEVLCTLSDVIFASAQLLRPRGRLFLCQRAERLTELISLMTFHKIPPKRLRFVHPKPSAPANLVLVMAMNGASSAFVDVLPPLVVYDENGRETIDLRDIYGI